MEITERTVTSFSGQTSSSAGDIPDIVVHQHEEHSDVLVIDEAGCGNVIWISKLAAARLGDMLMSWAES